MLVIEETTTKQIEELVSIFSDSSVKNLKYKEINIELELRLGKFFDRFISGVSYDDFSRFYSFFMNNEAFSKIADNLSLDITVKLEGLMLRISLNTMDEIMNYCKSNIINLNSPNVIFTSKKRLHNEDLLNYDNRIAVSEETTYSLVDLLKELDVSEERLGKLIYETEKSYRLKKRVSFQTETLPFRFDLTQTKADLNRKGQIALDEDLLSSEIFNISPIYEVEAEYVYSRDDASSLEDKKRLNKLVRSILEFLLVIRQDNELVLSKKERDTVITNFMKLRFDKESVDYEFENFYNRPDVNYNKIFPGAKVSTLELQNLLKSSGDIPYIYKNYNVTDKADGERYMLFIDTDKYIYLINDRLEIIKTDCRSSSTKSRKTVLDGELIVSIVNGVKQYRYYAFDILFYASSNICDLPLFAETGKKSRHGYLQEIVDDIQKSKMVLMNDTPILQVFAKTYYKLNIGEENVEKMQQFCAKIWDNRVETYPYNLDGLIFTRNSDEYPLGKLWANTLKWKPPQENSIDFLLKFKEEDTILEGGKKYRVGNLYSGMVVEKGKYRDYVETLFDIPNSLSKDPTHLIRIPVDEDGNSKGIKDGVIIQNETIVECIWDYSKNCWVVSKTRLDKTQKYRESGYKISGTANNLAVATSIWRTIIDFISEQLITGKISMEDHTKQKGQAYYSKVGTDVTQPLRSFNNFLKSVLIGGARIAGDSLLDLSCGRGGDMYKWKASKYNRIVGLDYSKNGIENLNPEFGAYGRLLSLRSKGDEWAKSKDIRFFWADTSKITTSNYPNGICNASKKVEAIEALRDKFNVITSFFTAHYYFENNMKIRGFMQNIHDNLLINGYALITTFDAESIDKALTNIRKGNSIRGLVDKTYVWDIKKDYKKNVELKGDETSVGLQISVKFESISDEHIPEWLVHKDYLITVAKQYGLVLISNEETKEKFNLEHSTALFEEILDKYNPDISDELENLKKTELGKIFARDIEKLYDDVNVALRQYIKYNRYYIFKKIATDSKIPREWEGRLKDIHCLEGAVPVVLAPKEPGIIAVVEEAKAEVPAISKKVTIDDLEKELEEPIIIEPPPPKKKLIKKVAPTPSEKPSSVSSLKELEEAPIIIEVPPPKKKLVKKTTPEVSSVSSINVSSTVSSEVSKVKKTLEPTLVSTEISSVSSKETAKVPESSKEVRSETPKKPRAKKNVEESEVRSETPSKRRTKKESSIFNTESVSSEVLKETPKKPRTKKNITPETSEEVGIKPAKKTVAEMLLVPEKPQTANIAETGIELEEEELALLIDEKPRKKKKAPKN